MSQTEWPTFERVPAVAFVDVDGTLLAQTTTYLFARILYRRGLIRRSFFLRALYHGLQHRFGRLDYGRLIAIGLNSIAKTGNGDRARIVITRPGDPATVDLPELFRYAHDTRGDRARPAVAARSRPRLLRRRKTLLGRSMGPVARRQYGRCRRLRRQLERSGITGKSRPGRRRPAPRSPASARPNKRLGRRAPEKTASRKTRQRAGSASRSCARNLTP
jgi:hypothetical protein